MGTYKVLQDIEAEDKLLGPLTLKQFIFAILALACGYINFLLLTKGAGFLVAVFILPMALFGILAWPWSREQTTDVWLLAKLRFHIKPRRRIWDQTGAKDLVTITAPVKEEKNYSDGLSEGEVRSRLKALASTIDSRGWAIKNVNVNLSSQPGFGAAISSDRLIDISSLPQEVSTEDVNAADDIMDEQNNPTAQNLARMISAKASNQKERLMNRLKRSATADQPAEQPGADYWFLNQPAAVPDGQAMFAATATVQPQDNPAPAAPAAATPADYGNLHTVQPLPSQPFMTLPAPVPDESPTSSSKTPDPAILELANNDDLNVATIARQANKNKGDLEDGEVVVPLR